LLKSEEVESEVLDEPPYAEGETNGTGLKDIVESCGRDIESLVSTLADLEPVFHPNEVRHERRSKWADSIAIKELDPRPSRSRRVQVQTPFEYRERVVEEFDNPYHVEHRIHETRRMSPTRPMLYRTFNTL
jgi:hypothetical protein